MYTALGNTVKTLQVRRNSNFGPKMPTGHTTGVNNLLHQCLLFLVLIFKTADLSPPPALDSTQPPDNLSEFEEIEILGPKCHCQGQQIFRMALADFGPFLQNH